MPIKPPRVGVATGGGVLVNGGDVVSFRGYTEFKNNTSGSVGGKRITVTCVRCGQGCCVTHSKGYVKTVVLVGSNARPISGMLPMPFVVAAQAVE